MCPFCNDVSHVVGRYVEFPGIILLPDFLTKEEEREILCKIDEHDWVESQSGRRKQVSEILLLV